MNQIVVENTNWTINRVYDNFPDAAKRWEALGQQDSNIHWMYGQECGLLITAGVPAMLAYAAIGRKAGKTSQTIRKSYYTYKTFSDEQREEFHLVPYSVFQHARSADNPDEVLQYYQDENGKSGCSVDEIEAVFPLTETEEERDGFKNSDMPRYLYGAWRQMIGLNGNRKQAEYHLNEFVKLVETDKK